MIKSVKNVDGAIEHLIFFFKYKPTFSAFFCSDPLPLYSCGFRTPRYIVVPISFEFQAAESGNFVVFDYDNTYNKEGIIYR